ncbi:MAG: DUF6516 family protein [Candidatus Jettenia sp. CY-1]|nr:MAG: DUF6516 family protein [Candidatus Jettenia sp. CY-1]
MLLTEYFARLVKGIEEYSKTNLIIDTDLHLDCRTEKIGIIKGVITFIDDSKLFFTEYLDVRYKIEKLTYSFHFQQKDGKLIFRYDNADHKPRLNFNSHKHLSSDEIVQSSIPEISDIFEEMMDSLLRIK